jgi:two-component system, OmpR family, KDP operon response regulator KdpE
VKILVVDDDPDLCQLLQHVLAQEGTEVATVDSGHGALRAFYDLQPDLVLLDIMLPDLDGYEVCLRLRDLSDVPIIMLTALEQNDAIVKGLICGADDYVTKPFHLPVLRARIDAVLRRVAPRHRSAKPDGYGDGYLTIELEQHRVLVQGERVALSPTEYKLLAALVEHAGQLLTYQQLLEQVWGVGYHEQLEYIHVYISRLRHKLEPDPLAPRYLLTEPRVGYRFEPAPHSVPAGPS